ncbi:MAG: hypothetical protein ACK56F_09645, partial [bacterium]
MPPGHGCVLEAVLRKKSRKLDVCRTGLVLADQLISATWREDKEPTLLSAERLPGDAARDQLISDTWREDKEPTLLSKDRLPGEAARDQLISSVRPASPMTAEKPGNKAFIQLFAGPYTRDSFAVAGHQLVSSSEPTGT